MKFKIYDNVNIIDNKSLDSIWEILLLSFDSNELRDYEEIKSLLKSPYFKIITFEEDEAIIGCMFLWQLTDFLFIENLAVNPNKRNLGLGQQSLEFIKEKYNLPIVLEAEVGDTEIQKRRLNFYKRNGFKINKYSYIMPALKKDSNPLPLLILSYPKALPKNRYLCVKETIYKIVYDGKII